MAPAYKQMRGDLIVMGNFCVAADSGCDLPAALFAERSIYAYHMKYAIGEKEYNDRMTPEDCVAFYNRMRDGAVPHTSQIKTFSQTLINRLGFQGSFINYIGPTIGSHSGPGLIAACPGLCECLSPITGAAGWVKAQ